MRASAMLASTLGAMLAGAAPAIAQSDGEIRQRIIRESIARYPGNGPCPYSVDSNGRRYGGRSAHSRAGNAAPKCYPSDISAAEVAAYRRTLQRR